MVHRKANTRAGIGLVRQAVDAVGGSQPSTGMGIMVRQCHADVLGVETQPLKHIDEAKPGVDAFTDAGFDHKDQLLMPIRSRSNSLKQTLKAFKEIVFCSRFGNFDIRGRCHVFSLVGPAIAGQKIKSEVQPRPRTNLQGQHTDGRMDNQRREGLPFIFFAPASTAARSVSFARWE